MFSRSFRFWLAAIGPHSGAQTLSADSQNGTSVRQRTYQILEHSRRRDLSSRLLDWFLIVLINANVAAVAAQSIPDLPSAVFARLQVFDRCCVVVFLLEYLARLWTSPEHALLQRYGTGGARLRSALTPLMLIDALALLPFALEFAFPQHALVRLTRLIRFLKLARYSPALGTIGSVLTAERRALLACVVIFAGVLLLAAAAIYAVEGTQQPDRFGDMPKAMWWAASMLAKIGGPGTEPVTALGRIVAVITVMLGIFCFALPVAIIARGFYEEIRRRDFIITFAMIARIPLFSRLDAASISDLIGILSARTVPTGTVIVQKGDQADAMFLIASGLVDVLGDGTNVRLAEGDYFGEMALLLQERRNATVIAVRLTDLLVLNAGDFHRLVQRNPEIADSVQRVAQARAATTIR